MVSARTVVSSSYAGRRRFCTAVGLLSLFSGVVARSQGFANPAPFVNLPSQPATRASGLVSNYGKLPLAFEVNQGQTDGRVKFLSRGRGYALFLTGDEAVLTLQSVSQDANRESHPTNVKTPAVEIANRKPASENSKLKSVLRMKLVGANARAAVMGIDELPGKSNYFIGNDPKMWRTNVANYAKVRYRDVYPGVDLVYYGNQGGQLEYDFVVAPGADPNVLTLDVSGDIMRTAKSERRSSLRIAPNGDLVVKTNSGEVRFQKPVVYQEQLRTRHSVDGRYVLRGNRGVGFEVASYDRSKPLVIDPVLIYSTYLGGNAVDAGKGIAADSAGNAYITGQTNSTNFPTAAPPLQPALGGPGAQNAFVTKLNASGSALVYSTYLGGSFIARLGGGVDVGAAIAVDSAGNAYVTGHTNSTDFPTTASPFQVALGGTDNAFVAKLNAAGNALVYSTYLGGSRDDRGFGIALDSVANAYVTGQTTSIDFPIASPFQPTNHSTVNRTNAFVTKLNAAGSALVYSTYLGGSVQDIGNGIAVDSAGSAYVTGTATSSDFPTASPFQLVCGACTFGANGNAFVTKLNAAGSVLVYSTFLGGNAQDKGLGIAVDSSGNAYITGQTSSANFPSASPIQIAFGGGGDDAFVTELNAAGSALVYSTYLGGSGNDIGFAIQVDSGGNAYVAGQTLSPNFPTASPIQTTGSVFVASLNAAGSALVYSTYLGGSGFDAGLGIALDATANVYVTGQTSSTNFTKVSPFQPALGGVINAFVAKIASDFVAAPAISLSPASLTFPPQNVGTSAFAPAMTITNTGTANLIISTVAVTGGPNAGDFGKSVDGCTGTTVLPGNNCMVQVSFTPSAAGSRSASLSFTDNVAGSPQNVPLTGTGVATACATDTTSSVSVTRSGFTYNFATQRFYQTVKLTNTGGSPIAGPVDLVLDGLSTNALLFSGSGTTSCAAPLGSPYITASTGSIAPGGSVSVTLQFTDPTHATTTYHTRVLSGSGTP